jgi:hypothetical protein
MIRSLDLCSRSTKPDKSFPSSTLTHTFRCAFQGLTDPQGAISVYARLEAQSFIVKGCGLSSKLTTR